MKLEIYDFPAKIWKFIPTLNASQIVVELRDKNTQSIHYQVIPSGIKISPQNGKWQGLAEVSNEIAFIHGYLRPEFPIRKGIWAHQLSDGKLLWEQTEMNFVCFDSNSEGIIVNLSAKGEIYLLLNGKTGEILTENFAISASQIKENQQNRYKAYHYSLVIKPNEGDFATFAEKITFFTQKENIQAIEYISTEKNDFFTFYTNENQQIQQYFLVIEQAKMLFFKAINENVSEISYETFFVVSSKIVLLLADNQLGIINLGS
jgi:hypothetical protein